LLWHTGSRFPTRLYTGVLLVIVLLRQDGLNALFQNRQLSLGDLPHRHKINTHVVVNQDVAQPGNAPPRDLRVLRPKGSGQPFGGFPNHLKLSDYGILPVRGREKAIAPDRNVGFNSLDGVQDMPEIYLIASHRLTASFSTSSRMYGLIAASVTTSTWQPSRSSRSCLIATRSSRLRPGSSFTRKSMSLSALASPRAREPKT